MNKILLNTALLLAISTSCVNASADDTREAKSFRAVGVDNPGARANLEQINGIIGDDPETRAVYESIRTSNVRLWPEQLRSHYLDYLSRKEGPLTKRETTLRSALQSLASEIQPSELQGVKLKHTVTKVASGERAPVVQEDFAGELHKAKTVAEADEERRKATQERLAKASADTEAQFRANTSLADRLVNIARRRALAEEQMEELGQQADAVQLARMEELRAQLTRLEQPTTEARDNLEAATRLKAEMEDRNRKAQEDQETANLINASVDLDTIPIAQAKRETIKEEVDAIMLDPARRDAERQSVERQNNITDPASANAFIFGESANVRGRYLLARCFAANLVDSALQQRGRAAALLEEATAREARAADALKGLDEEFARISAAIAALAPSS